MLSSKMCTEKDLLNAISKCLEGSFFRSSIHIEKDTKVTSVLLHSVNPYEVRTLNTWE